jgi:hypothetical protein
VLIGLTCAAVGLAGFLVFLDIPGFAGGFAALGLGGLLTAVRGATFEIEVQGGWMTFRSLSSASRPVDLRQLTNVTTPGRVMMLRDRRGTVAWLALDGTRPSQRRRLLAALEPYVMAGHVTGASLVREALSGEQWWPLRRLRTGSRRSDAGVRPR